MTNLAVFLYALLLVLAYSASAATDRVCSDPPIETAQQAICWAKFYAKYPDSLLSSYAVTARERKSLGEWLVIFQPSDEMGGAMFVTSLRHLLLMHN